MRLDVKKCSFVRPVPDYLSDDGTIHVFVSTTHTNIMGIPDKNDVSQLRLVVIDIECATTVKGQFPTPLRDPVIIVSILCTRLMTHTSGEFEPEKKHDKCISTDDYSDTEDYDTDIERNDETCMRQSGSGNVSYYIVTTGTSKTIPEAHTIYCPEGEIQLFEQVQKIVLNFDPDIISGYNVEMFDLDYMITRASLLGIPDTMNMGRFVDMPPYKKTKQTHNKTKNKKNQTSTKKSSVTRKMLRDMFHIVIPGRHCIDMMAYIKKSTMRLD